MRGLVDRRRTPSAAIGEGHITIHVVFHGRLPLDSHPVPLLSNGRLLVASEAFPRQDRVELMLGSGIDVSVEVVKDAREAQAQRRLLHGPVCVVDTAW